MNAAVFAFSRQGCRTARRIIQCLEDGTVQAYTIERFGEEGFAPLPSSPNFYGRIFQDADAMVFVGSCGIAVRKIAPFVKDKTLDPAVIVVDELGNFVIPILSGHIGGANELARKLADELGAVPVITTATDINHKFSVDVWAAKNSCKISDMTVAKAVSAAILEGNVPLHSDFPIVTQYPRSVVPGNSGAIGIFISYKEAAPFSRTLRLIPPVLHLGIGCRKGMDAATIAEVVDKVLKRNNLDFRAIKCAASIDLKSGEQGLLQFCEARRLPVFFYSPQELQKVPGKFTASEFVSSITGVDNVCERAALIGAEKLIVHKTACSGVTVALAEEHWEVRFG